MLCLLGLVLTGSVSGVHNGVDIAVHVPTNNKVLVTGNATTSKCVCASCLVVSLCTFS
jgi:hypothetical protein